VTLLRCIGWLSRDDLSLRPRAAGPIIETPHAQEIGIYTFEYSIIPHLGNWQIALPEVSSFNCGLKGRFTSIHKGILPSQLRMIDQASNDFLISTMKTSEKGNGIILRGVNLTENNILASTEINGFTINQAIAIKLDEDKKIMGFTISNNSFKRQVKPHQIQSTFLE
jgi:alpha-mannosidase